MDSRFGVLLAISLIVSVYDVFIISGNGDVGAGNGGSEDSFKQFDYAEEEEAPAYKYSEQSQKEDDEEVKIREPTGSQDAAFKPSINMAPVRFAFCVSCGYRQAYEQFAQILREKYPGINVIGENYPPHIVRSISAQIIGFAKIALIVCIVMGRTPFPAFNLETPNFYQWMLNNKLSAALMIFLLSNAIEGMLQSTGAFEIYIENERIWSKLESGRVPSPPELFQSIESHIAIRGGRRFDDTGSFGIDGT